VAGNLIDAQTEQRGLDVAHSTKRKSLAPISRLSSALLLMIFTSNYREVRSRHKAVESAIIYSHVCKNWRSVTLACHFLWSHLSTRFSSQLIDTLVLRSRPHPLSVYIELGHKKRTAMQILKHLPFIQELALDEVTVNLQTLLDRPAPLLQCFSAAADYDDNRVRFEDGLFGGDAPCLEQVVLLACVIPWDSGVLRCLTSLTVVLPPESGRPTLSELKGVLRACPKLRSLKLKDASPNFSGVDPPFPGSHEMIQLPQMVSLVLNDERQDFPKLIQHIHIPSRAVLRLESRGTEIWPLRSIVAVTLEEHSRTQRQDDLSIRSLRISILYHEIRIEAMSVAPDFTSEAQDGEQPLWQLVVAFKYWEHNDVDWLLDVLYSIPLTDVTHLHLFGWQAVRSDAIPTIVALMPQVDTLTLPMTMLPSIWSIPQPTDPIGLDPFLLCTQLKNVAFDIEFTKQFVGIYLLEGWLRQRSERGLRLTRLAVKIKANEFEQTKGKRQELQQKAAPYVDHIVYVRKVRRNLSP
jgi:hypothetical protein